MNTSGLSLEQGPPLGVPAGFFAVAPVSMLGAGALLASQGAELALSRSMPAALVATHLGTLGFLGAVMLGALYQMIPVVAGAPLPGARAAHGVQVALVAGVASLLAAFLGAPTWLYWVALQLLLGGGLVFLAQAGVALHLAPTRDHTVRGIRWAVAALLATALVGTTLAFSRATGISVGSPSRVVGAHAALGLVGWVGGLLVAVSWKILPMFYLAPEAPPWARRLTLASLTLLTVGVPLAALAGAPPWAIPALATPAAAAVWGLQPALALRALARRRRKRADDSLRAWRAGLLVAPLVLAVAALSWQGESPQAPVLLGWLAVWGWAGLIVHGMLSRIVPFLVWFHRLSPLVGRVPIPPMRRLWPGRALRLGLLAHGAAVALVAAGAWSPAWPPSAWLMRAGGILLILAGAALGWGLWRTLRTPAPEARPPMDDQAAQALAWRPPGSAA